MADRSFVTHRLQGLHDELRPGRTRSLEDEAVAELINRALHTKPAAATPVHTAEELRRVADRGVTLDSRREARALAALLQDATWRFEHPPTKLAGRRAAAARV